MTIDQLREQNLIIFECISGSKAQGLSTPSSDTDIKGVFLLPKEQFYGLDYTPQVSNETNDIVFYELGRFIELLSFNNPNILELLNTPADKIIYKHPFLNELDSSKILSKQCMKSFGNFAMSQVKKAKGLNKKIVNPVDKERKSVLSFCYVTNEKGSVPLLDFLEKNNWQQEDCGLAKISNMKDLFALYHNKNANYQGVIRTEQANEICLSSIAKGEVMKTVLYFNKDGYSRYCKDYREYWQWVEDRNETRFQNTQSHGKNYDAKNMMHTFRLLQMAIEIAKENQVNVHRNDRDFLLSIKSGKFEYEELVALAEEKQQEMRLAFEQCDLPEKPDTVYLEEILVKLREKFYSK